MRRHSSAVRSGKRVDTGSAALLTGCRPGRTVRASASDLVRDAIRRDVSRHREGALADSSTRLGARTVADIHRDRRAALIEARCGGASQAAPRAGDDGDAPRKITVFHPENYLTVPN